jgi:hypothetical protein
MKKASGILAFGAMVLFAAQALAADFAGEATVTSVSISDNTNHGGTTKLLEINFSSNIAMCAGTGNLLQIQSSESTLFEDMVKQAQAAFLSGRVLRAGTSNASGSCKTFYLQMK